MNAIYALYADPDAAQRAVTLIERAGPRLGLSVQKIEVLSSEPFEEHEFGRREAKSYMPWLAAFGGVLGGLSAYQFVTAVQRSFPIVTGGMSITPLWTNGIIVYELTMLGAILMTVVTLLLRARLPDWRKQLYDPAVSEGMILVGVTQPPSGSVAEIERVFREAGAEQVKRV